MKVWPVLRCKDEGDDLVAVYGSKELAEEHVRLMPHDYCIEIDVHSELISEAVDPVEQKKRHDEAEAARVQQEERNRHQERNHAAASAYKIADVLAGGGKPSLCHCATFNSDNYFITSNGYCRYCGGFEPETFRRACGETALAEAIDLLAIHHRVRMRELVGPIAEWPDEISV